MSTQPAPARSFKTPGGTTLPFFMIERSKKDKETGQWIKLPPQPYLQVAYRLVWFREEHPDWTIETEHLTLENPANRAIFRAYIKNEAGRVIATAVKQETATDFADYIEKAETGAIGRALALCGYGTQYAPELDEGDRIVDSPMTPAKKPTAVENFNKTMPPHVPPPAAAATKPVLPAKKPVSRAGQTIAAGMTSQPTA